MKYTIILAIGMALGIYMSQEPKIEYIEVGTCSELFYEYRNSDRPNKSIQEFNSNTGCSYIQEYKNALK